MHSRNLCLATNYLTERNEVIRREEDPTLFKRGLPFPECYEHFPLSMPNPMNNNSDELALSTGMQYRNIDYAKRARRVKRGGSVRKLGDRTDDAFNSGIYEVRKPGDRNSLSMPDLGAENRKLIEELKAQRALLRTVDLSDPYDLEGLAQSREVLASTTESFKDIMRRKNHLRAGHPMKAAGDELTAQELHPVCRKGLTHQQLVGFGQATNYSHPLLGPRIQSTYREGTGSAQGWYPAPEPDMSLGEDIPPKKKPNDSCWWKRGEPEWKKINSTYRLGPGSGRPAIYPKNVSTGPEDHPLAIPCQLRNIANGVYKGVKMEPLTR